VKLLTFTGVLGLALVFVAASPVSAASKRDLVQLRVSVFNSSPVLPSTIEAGETEAGRVLMYAGIEVIWLNCPQDAPHEVSRGLCSAVSFPSHLSLQLLRSSRGLRTSTVGISFLEHGEGCYADLFYEPIVNLQVTTHVDPSVVLGYAMAHELGHLLLGVNSHSPSGLMRAHWTRADLANASKGKLQFSRQESFRIMNRLAARVPQDSQAYVSAKTTCTITRTNRALATTVQTDASKNPM